MTYFRDEEEDLIASGLNNPDPKAPAELPPAPGPQTQSVPVQKPQLAKRRKQPLPISNSAPEEAKTISATGGDPVTTTAAAGVKIPYTPNEDRKLVQLYVQLLAENSPLLLAGQNLNNNKKGQVEVFQHLSAQHFPTRSPSSLQNRWFSHLLPLILRRGFAAVGGGLDFRSLGFRTQCEMDQVIIIQDGQLKPAAVCSQQFTPPPNHQNQGQPGLMLKLGGGEGEDDQHHFDAEFARRLEQMAFDTQSSRSEAVSALHVSSGKWGVARRYLQNPETVRHLTFSVRDDGLILKWVQDQQYETVPNKYKRTFPPVDEPQDEFERFYATFDEMEKIRGSELIQDRIKFLRSIDEELEHRLLLTC